MEALNWEAVSAIAETIGVVALVASLIYVAIQVQQNNMEIRLNTEAAKISAYHQTIEQVVVAWTDKEFAGLSSRYEESPDSLTVEERARLEVLWVPALFGHEIALELYGKGLIDSRLWENMLVNNLWLLTGTMPMSMLKQRPGPLSRQLLAELEKHVRP
ncbi:MAG: L-2-hydroxyglutarate oxidase LhgO [Limisphaerales bacterium]|jgi:L-2-hydroxyglutarate oxidase LhgO